MKRKIIKIDEKKCNGCGKCIPNCPEGALQIIDGKARLVSDLFCDGLGACIGECPLGAISTIEREAAAYDEKTVMTKNIIPAGANTVKAHLQHLKEHNEEKLLEIAIRILKENKLPVPEFAEAAKLPCGCPGTLVQSIQRDSEAACPASEKVESQLRQWPVQLRLINPSAGYFDNADVLICADCVPYAYGDFQQRLLKGRVVITFCPKLDDCLDEYVNKLTELFMQKEIKSITIARMIVPCCGGTEQIVRKALAASGKNIKADIKIISIQGEIN